MVPLFRRLIALLVCLHVWACFGLPTQVAYRCTMMAGTRIAAPCCPTSIADTHEYATIHDHCCEELPKPTIDMSGPQPHKVAQQVAHIVAVISRGLATTHDLPARPQVTRFSSGIPPNFAPPRQGITVLQV
ncbi:MAG TPA: hypothetical protein PKO07_13165 [Pseudomonadota bacterium]|nr:hypothetical protein [Pseudomonadota bacterium]HNN51969.1 hypothetical protein [Pseudomonadota bacterium]